MTIHTLTQNQELEERGKAKLELVGVRYVGPKSSIPVGKYQRQAGWPGASPLQGGHIREDGTRAPGPIQLALVPDWTDDDVEDRTVIALENDPDVEVVYDRSELAKALLERNYLPSDVFDRGYDKDLRERVFDTLGLEDVGRKNVAGYREQLREIAGVDEELTDEEVRDAGRVGEYKNDFARSELLAATTAFGADFERSSTKTEMAEWLADRDADAAERALKDHESVEPVVDENDTTDTEEAGTVPDGYDDWTVSEVEDWTAGAAAGDLKATLTHERHNKNRKTATGAIKAALGGDN